MSSRRTFLKQTASLGLVLTTTRLSPAVGVNDKIGVAVIGVRGQGGAR